jgi:dihydroorotase (multifunctional complex type)
MHDLRILNATVISDGMASGLDVAVAGGQIVDMALPGGLGSAREEIDATSQWLLPGVVDVHFHCRAPSHPERGDFDSETRAAAAGGVTTILEMPISEPACSTPEVLRSRRALGERDAWVNFALFAGGAVTSEDQARALLQAGAIGFKLFMTTPPPGREAEFEGLSAPNAALIHKALGAIAATGATCTIHAEHQQLIDGLSTDGVGFARRPPIIEAAAVGLAAIIARDVGARAHIAHVTSRQGTDVLRSARLLHSGLSAETSPHYLMFNESVVARSGGYAKVAPPIRSEDDRLALWDALRSGVISVVASDHAPFRPEEKRRPDWDDIPPGIPGVELMLPLLIDASLRGELPREQVPILLGSNPARLFGLYPAKGSVSVGSDADFVLVETASSQIVRTSRMHSRAAESAVVYEGLKLRGRVAATYVNGRAVYMGGRLIERAGRFVSNHLVRSDAVPAARP